VTWNFADNMRTTLGVRYTTEDQEADHPLDKSFSGGWTYPFGTYGDTPEEYDRFEAEAPAGLVAAYDTNLWEGALGTFEHDIKGRKRGEDNASWSLNLEYDLNEDLLLYGTVGTGFKGGGFDGRFLKPTDNPNFEYEDEEATSAEIGNKMTLLDGGMTLNIAAFYTTIDDYQVSVFDGATAFLVTNAAEVETYGVETDLRWAATDSLTIGAAVSYLQATYEDFKNNASTVVQSLAAAEAEGPINSCRNPLDPLSTGTDVSGESQIYSPDWSGNLNAEYRIAVSDSLELSTFVNLNYSDEFVIASDLDENTIQDSFTKIDARIALGSMDGVWEVAVIGKNLTDEDTISPSNDQPLVPGNFYAQTDRLRSCAIQATYNFEHAL
jgi:iron complex outermembrane receptor protein